MSNHPILAVCLPGENFCAEWVSAWTYLLLHLSRRFNLAVLQAYTPCVHVTRGTIHQELLKMDPQPDYVLWIDDDNILTMQQFDQLFEDLLFYPEASVVCGWCWIRHTDSTPARTSCGWIGPDGQRRFATSIELSNGHRLVEIDVTGFPAVLMRGEVIAKAGPHPFAAILGDQYPYGMTGEDHAFCVNSRERGGCRWFVDADIQVPHLKRLVYNPPPEQLVATKDFVPCPATGPQVKGEQEA